MKDTTTEAAGVGKRQWTTVAPMSLTGPIAFVLMWTSGAIVTPFGLEQVSPQIFLTIRAAGCAVVVWIVWGCLGRDRLPTSGRGWRLTVSTALLMQVGYQAAFFIALDQGINPGMLALIVSAQPLLTAVLSGTRRSRTWVILGIGLAGVGLAVASDFDSAHPGSKSAYLVAGGALLAITTGTMTQKANSGSGIWANLAIQSTISATVFAVALPVVGPGKWEPGWQFVASAGWMILVVSVGATALLYFMVGRRDAVTVTSLFFLVPAVTALLDRLINGTTLPMLTLLGFGLTIVALAMIQRRATGR